MYQSFIIEPNQISDMIEEINENNEKIVSITSIDTNQLIVVTEYSEKSVKGMLNIINKK